MRRISVALAVGGTSLLVAACMGDRDSTSPRSVVPGNRASMNATVTSATCDYNNTMKGLARDYFNGGATRNTVLNLIGQMSSATTAADRQGFAFSIMKQVASARLTSATTTAAAGGLFVNYVLGCADLDDSLLYGHAALALSSGIFEVRGGSGDATYQALAFVKNTAGAKALATPRWGVQPTLANNAWSTNGKTYLVFGYPFYALAEDGVGAPAAINTNETNPAPGYNAFELGTVPAGSEAGNKLLVGLCVNAFTSGSQDVNLFFHSDEIQVNTSPAFCTTSNVPGFASLSQSWFTRLASAFAPKALVAQDFDSKLGGLPSGWSPFHSGRLKGSSTFLTFTPQPSDGFVNVVQPDVVVTVTVPSTDPNAPAGTKVPAPAGIQVTLKIAGNNGAPATFSANGQTGKSVTAVTNSNGLAIFTNFSVSKAGGYLASASGSLGGLAATLGTTSTMFWIKNKTP